MLIIVSLIYTLSSVCAASTPIDLDTLNAQQSIVTFSQKRLYGEDLLNIKAKKGPSGLLLAIGDRDPKKDMGIVSLRCLDIYRSGDPTSPFGSTEFVLWRPSDNCLTCSIYAGSNHDTGVFYHYGEISFLTKATNLASVAISKVTECDGVATVQYSLPQAVDGNCYSFYVTTRLDTLPAFTLSGYKNADLVFQLAYDKRAQKPKGFE